MPSVSHVVVVMILEGVNGLSVIYVVCLAVREFHRDSLWCFSNTRGTLPPVSIRKPTKVHMFIYKLPSTILFLSKSTTLPIKKVQLVEKAFRIVRYFFPTKSLERSNPTSDPFILS